MVGVPNLTRVRRSNWDCYWGASKTFLGGTDVVDLSAIVIKYSPLKIGTTGPLVLDHWFDGIDGEVNIELREFNRAQFLLLTPWTSGSGTLLATPAAGARLYQYAQKAVFHPNDVAADDLTQDFTLLKTVPVLLPPRRDGVTDDKTQLKLLVYLDQAQLPAAVWHYFGAPPS